MCSRKTYLVEVDQVIKVGVLVVLDVKSWSGGPRFEIGIGLVSVSHQTTNRGYFFKIKYSRFELALKVIIVL